MCVVGALPVEIRVSFRNRFRWPLHDEDAVEVWRGNEQLGEISGETMRHLVQHHMAGYELQRRVSEELDHQRPEHPSRVIVQRFQRELPREPFTAKDRAVLRDRRRRPRKRRK
jgi:hypothetical protein